MRGELAVAPADANFTATDCWQPWCASSRSSGDLSFPESTGNVLWCHQSVWTGFSMPLVLSKASETPRGCVEGRRDLAGRGATCVPGQGIPILLVPCVAEGEKKKKKTQMEIVSDRFLTPAMAWEQWELGGCLSRRVVGLGELRSPAGCRDGWMAMLVVDTLK